METLQAILLGIVQGITEFLPVSSSGHLQIAKALLGVELEDNLLFDVTLHAATVLSTIVVLWSEVWRLLKGLFSRRFTSEQAYVLKIAVSMIPIGIVGFCFKDRIEAMLNAPWILALVGGMLLLTAALLAFAYYARPREKEQISYRDAFIIGIAQAVAALPGLSRSGSTIATGSALGQPQGGRRPILVSDGAGTHTGRDDARDSERRSDSECRRCTTDRWIRSGIRDGMRRLQIHARNRQTGQTHLVRTLPCGSRYRLAV